jgi:DNA-binding XRE family transcriptional regulator
MMDEPSAASRGRSTRQSASSRLPPAKTSAAHHKLANAIRSTREQTGHSQEKAARLAGVERSYFGCVERGEVNISVGMLVRIAAGLNTTASELCARARL